MAIVYTVRVPWISFKITESCFDDYNGKIRKFVILTPTVNMSRPPQVTP